MEELNKFYTPTIEEFYIGFEFEEYSREWLGKRDFSPREFQWKPLKFNTSSSLSKITNLIKQNRIRIKHLDKDDVESLGWKLILEWQDTLKFQKDQFEYLLFNKETNLVIIHNGEEYEDYVCWFIGTIRNKSELIKLLKQLNIN